MPANIPVARVFPLRAQAAALQIYISKGAMVVSLDSAVHGVPLD